MNLARVFLGSLARRRLATLFSIAAIVLGVALGVAVHAVHQSALSEFGRGMRSLTGEADLLVGADGLQSGVRALAGAAISSRSKASLAC